MDMVLGGSYILVADGIDSTRETVKTAKTAKQFSLRPSCAFRFYSVGRSTKPSQLPGTSLERTEVVGGAKQVRLARIAGTAAEMARTIKLEVIDEAIPKSGVAECLAR